MKILVPIKRVIDANVRVQLKRDNSGVATDGVKMSINPFDEIAVEEALRIRERGTAAEIVVVSIGPADVQAQLRTALAMGADRAIHVEASDGLQPLHVARILLALVAREHPELVIMGKQAIDDDCNQTGQMLAALWDRPQATFVSRLELADGRVIATREVDAGLETLEIDLPAVVTTDLRLNEPRFVKMPDIMKARQKKLETVPLAALGVEAPPALQVLGYAPPPRRSSGRKVADVAELVQALKERGVL
ncbi:MAG TPA: electron transfer flavoprotein subunit beta/FixA family protein [Gammaproteobacteria bacterium]|nr:electron transfer flavoprotein subunit beta/FixA family protein [Gammaproteobacteria bacterium]